MYKCMKKRILPFLLALAFCLSFLPATVLAADPAVTVTKTNIKVDSLYNSEGYASLSIYGGGTAAPKYALVDSTGKFVFEYGVFPCQFSLYDGVFVNGIVREQHEWGATGDYSIFDLSGKQIASDTYDYLTFHDGYGLAFKSEFGDETGESTDRFVIDKTGKRILTLPKVFNLTRGFGGTDFEFENQIWAVSYYGYVGGYSDGLMWIFTPRDFKNVSEFNSVAPESVSMEELYEGNYVGGYIDLQGKLVIERKFHTTYPFYEGLAVVKTEDNADKFGYTDKTGKLVIPAQFDSAGHFNEGYAAVATGQGYGYIDKTGKTVLPMEYDMAYGYGDGLFSVGKVSGTTTNQWGAEVTAYQHGFVDASGKVIVPLEYDDVSHFVNGTAYAIKDRTLYILTLGEVQDVPSDWAEKEVTAAIAAGLVPEALQAKYTSPVSRGAVAEMFVNLLEKSTGKTIDEILKEKGLAINENAFTDTKDKAVLAANALGIINGVGEGRFDPDGLFTRAQIAAIINRVANVLGVETAGFEHGFTDLAGHWADLELGWPVHAGIVNGVGEGKYDPEGALTTEQAILIAYRALEALGK